MRIAGLLFLGAMTMDAQSVIISAPSTDITPKGEVMVAHESQFNRFRSGSYWNSFTFGTVGISKNTEFATTLYGISRPASRNDAIGVGLKHRIVHWKSQSGWHLESTAGFMIPVSLAGKGSGYWTYGNVAVRVPGARTRVTAGPSFGTRQIFGRRTYATILAIEQPLSHGDRWAVVADWFSGTHDLAASIAGIAWRPRHELVIIAAYKVPNNAASGKPAPLIEVTYSFRGWR